MKKFFQVDKSGGRWVRLESISVVELEVGKVSAVIYAWFKGDRDKWSLIEGEKEEIQKVFTELMMKLEAE
jgi:hypothetical protein